MAQHTKKAIREGFLALLNEETVDKISIVDIARRSQVNRNTVYYYYEDVNDIVEDILSLEVQRIRDMEINASTWPDVYKQVTAFARTNRRAIYNLYNTKNQSQLENYYYDVLLVGMERFVSREAADLHPNAADVHALSVFYAAALLGLTIRWMRGGMVEDADTFVNRIAPLLDGDIQNALAKRVKNT